MSNPVERESQNKVEVLVERSLTDQKLIDSVLVNYEALFADEEGGAAQLQRCYDPEELRDVLSSDEYLKLLAIDKKGQLLSCCIVATNPNGARDAYANPARYEHQMTDGESLWYVTALFSVANRDQSTSKLLLSLADQVAENNAVLGYDHSEKNSKLPDMIRFVVERAGGDEDFYDDTEVGRQSFRMIRYRKAK